MNETVRQIKPDTCRVSEIESIRFLWRKTMKIYFNNLEFCQFRFWLYFFLNAALFLSVSLFHRNDKWKAVFVCLKNESNKSVFEKQKKRNERKNMNPFILSFIGLKAWGLSKNAISKCIKSKCTPIFVFMENIMFNVYTICIFRSFSTAKM